MFSHYFSELIKQLKANAAEHAVLDFSQVTLAETQLAELKDALQQNTRVGRIKWGQVEDKVLQAEIEQLLKRNNANYRDRPSDYEYAMLSEHVYETLTAGQPVSWKRTDGTVKSLSDWQVHTVFHDKKNGYYGAAYYHPKQHFLVLCHRGTDFKLAHLLAKEDSDLHADIQLAYNQIIMQQVSASVATQEMIALAIKKHWHFSLSGHSLGGWLAQISLLHCHQNYDYPHTHAVVFDAPGVASMAQRLQAIIADHQVLESVLDIKNYVAAPNVVNTLHKPFGRMYRVFPKFDLLTLGQAEIAYDTVAGIAAALFGVTLLEKFKPALEMLSSAPGHAITGIVDVFKADTGLPEDVQEVISWPVMRWPEESAGMDNAKRQLKELRQSLSFAPSLTDFKWANAPTWLAQLVGNWATQKALESASHYFLLDTQLVQVLCLLKDVHDNRMDNKALLDFLKMAKATQQVHVSQASLSFEEGYHLRYQTKYHTENYQINRLPQRQLPAGLITFAKTYVKYAENLFALREDLHPKQLGITIPNYAYKSALETHKAYDYLEITMGNVLYLRSQLYRYWQLMDEAKTFSQIYRHAIKKHLTELKQQLAEPKQSSKPQDAIKAQIEAIETKQKQLKEGELKQSLDLEGRRQALISDYQAQATLDAIDDKWQPSIEDAFVNLAIVEEMEQREAERKQPKTASTFGTHRGSLLESQSTKHISIEEIVKQKPGKLQRTLLLGRPGIGKSVLSHYIVWRWSQGQLWNERYKWVFWLKLRSLTDNQVVTSWLEIVNQTYLHYNYYNLTKREQQLLEKTLQDDAKNGRVLFILDGYDEIAELHQQNNWGYKKALDELLAMPQLIISSRHYYVSNIKVERKLEILGFTPASIQAYVKNYYSSQTEQAYALQRFIQQNPTAATIAHIPINLYMLCTNWQEHAFEAGSVNTLTRLYSQMTERLLRRYLEKSHLAMVGNLASDDVYKRCNIPLSVVERLAWNGVEADCIEFKGSIEPITTASKAIGLAEEARQQIVAQVAALGVIKFLGSEGRILAQKDFQFIHYSLQEFLAARYFVNLWREDEIKASQLLTKFKLNPNFEWVWAYAAGLMETEPAKLDNFLQKLLYEEPIDLLGMYSFRLLASCLDQAPEFLKLAKGKRYITEISQVVKKPLEKINKDALQTNNENRAVLVSYLIKQLAGTINLKRVTEIQDIFIDAYKSSKNEKGKIATLRGIGELEQANDKIITLLIEGLKDKSELIRFYAAEALCAIGRANEFVVASLVKALKEQDVLTTISVVAVLGEIGQANDKTVTALLTVLKNENDDVRGQAVNALGKLERASNRVITRLLELLKDRSSAVRMEAASALGKLGRVGVNVISELLKTLKDESEQVKRQAIKALGKLGQANGDLITALLEALSDKNYRIRIQAIKTLTKLGHTNNDVAAILIETLKDENKLVRAYAADALGKLGLHDSKIIAPLLPMLKDKVELVRAYTARALGRLGHKNDQVNKVLGGALKENSGIKIQTIKALDDLGQINDETIETLFETLKDENEGIKLQVEQILNKSGRKFIADKLRSLPTIGNAFHAIPNNLVVLIEYFIYSERYLNKGVQFSDNLLAERIQNILIRFGLALYLQKDNGNKNSIISFYQNKKLTEIKVEDNKIARADKLIATMKNKQVVKVDVVGNTQLTSSSWFGVAASELPAPALPLWPGVNSLDAPYQYITYDMSNLEGTTVTYSGELMPVGAENLAEEPTEPATQSATGNIFNYFQLDSQLALLNVIVRGVRQVLGYDQKIEDTQPIAVDTVQSEIALLKQRLNDYQRTLQAISAKLKNRAVSPQVEALKERVSYYHEVLVDTMADLNRLATKRRVTVQQWSQLRLQIEGFAETLAELKQDCKPAICHVPVIGPRFFQPQVMQLVSSRTLCLPKVIEPLPEEPRRTLGYNVRLGIA